MKYSFLKSLDESKLVKTDISLSKYTLREVLDYTMLYFLAIEILKESDEDIKGYVNKAFSLNLKFDKFKPGMNDLYFMLHIMFGKNAKQTIDDLKDPGNNTKIATYMSPDKQKVMRFLNYIRYNKPTAEGQNNRFFINLEDDLLIKKSEIKAIRRKVAVWDNSNESQKKHIIKMLMTALRSIRERSDIYRLLEKFYSSISEDEVKETKIDFKKSMMQSLREAELKALEPKEEIRETKYAELGIKSYGIPRKYMPQINAEHQAEYLSYLSSEGIAYAHEDVSVGSLKPTQAEFNQQKIEKTENQSTRPLVVSMDDFILDGHHRWTAAWQDDPRSTIDILRIYLNIDELIDITEKFDEVDHKSINESFQYKLEVDPGDPKTRLQLIKFIETYCSQFLAERGDVFLLSGRRGRGPAFVGASRPDRTSLSRHNMKQKIVNDEIAKQGFTVNRQNSIFTTVRLDTALNYGTIYFIFPMNGFESLISKNHNDLIVSLTTSRLVDFFDFNKETKDKIEKFLNINTNMLPRYIEQILYIALEKDSYEKPADTQTLETIIRDWHFGTNGSEINMDYNISLDELRNGLVVIDEHGLRGAIGEFYQGKIEDYKYYFSGGDGYQRRGINKEIMIKGQYVAVSHELMERFGLIGYFGGVVR